jgi:hypothetical protein
MYPATQKLTGNLHGAVSGKKKNWMILQQSIFKGTFLIELEGVIADESHGHEVGHEQLHRQTDAALALKGIDPQNIRKILILYPLTYPVRDCMLKMDMKQIRELQIDRMIKSRLFSADAIEIRLWLLEFDHRRW